MCQVQPKGVLTQHPPNPGSGMSPPLLPRDVGHCISSLPVDVSQPLEEEDSHGHVPPKLGVCDGWEIKPGGKTIEK